MKSSDNTDALVAMENAAPPLLFEKLPGTDLQLWPLLRWPLAKSAAEAELGTLAVRRGGTRASTFGRAAKRLVPNPFSSARLRRPNDALFIVTGNTYADTADGRSNWLVDDHARAVDGVVLQDLPIDLFTPHSQRSVWPRTYSFEDAIVRAEAAAKFAGLSDAELEYASDFVSRAYAAYEFPVTEKRRTETLRQFLIRVGRARHTARSFERVIDRVKPRVAFMQTGSYGDRSHLIRALKARGIHVAEHQHGWIGPSHAAYNFGGAFSHPDLARTIPDTLLTFGDFWSKKVRFPTATVTIGKPHLETKSSTAAPPSSREKVVMIVSSVFARDEITRMTLDVRDLLPQDWRVTMRPHPSERATCATLYPGLLQQARVSFDLESDVYASLGQVRGVIGLASTVLYEALAMNCEVYVKDSPLADLYIEDGVFGERITDAVGTERAVASIVNNASRGRAPYTQSTLDSIWKPNSIANFEAFVDSVR